MSSHTSSDNKITTVKVVYAPLPDDGDDEEGSAASEFATRAVDHLRKEFTKDVSTTTATLTSSAQAITQINVLTPFHMKDYALEHTEKGSCGTADGKEACSVMTIFIVSCGPDGSVHRSVRTISKALRKSKDNSIAGRNKSKNEEEGTHEVHPKELVSDISVLVNYTAVALLGHAVCKTSSEQAGDETFSAGRRFVQSIQHQLRQEQEDQRQDVQRMVLVKPVLETQVELVSPDKAFDPWLETLCRSVADHEFEF
jgi:hypothetical protein